MEMIEKVNGIIDLCTKETSTNPYEIFKNIVRSEFVAIHGPEHHVVDGACLLTAYKNAGGKINLKESLERLKNEGLKMPGAICAHWGVCGAVMSVGCALAIIDETGPLTEDGTWGKHMEYTAEAVKLIAMTHGPRCCKRDGMLALSMGIQYINEQTPIKIESTGAKCMYSAQNMQCIQEKCPYFSL